MKRQRDSVLNQWVKSQPDDQQAVAKRLGVKPGTLFAWLFRGFVPLKQIRKVAKATKIPKATYIAEYLNRKGAP